MFYSSYFLAKKGPLSLIWIAGHMRSRRLSKKKILQADIVQICDDLTNNINKFALSVQISLVLGASLVLQRKAQYLLKDVQDLRLLIRNVDRKGRPLGIDLPPEKRAGKKPLARVTEAFLQLDLDLAEANIREFMEQTDDDLLNMPLVGIARPEDITLPGPGPMYPKPHEELPLQDDFAVPVNPQDQTADLQKQGPVELDESAAGKERNELQTSGICHELSLLPPAARPSETAQADQFQIPEEPTQQLPLVQPEFREPEAVVPGSGRKGRGKRKKGLAVDIPAIIPNSIMKKNIENVRFATIPDTKERCPDFHLVKLKQNEKQSRKTGQFMEQSELASYMHRCIEEATAAHKMKGQTGDDPFAWCGPKPEPAPVATEPDQTEKPDSGRTSGKVPEKPVVEEFEHAVPVLPMDDIIPTDHVDKTILPVDSSVTAVEMTDNIPDNREKGRRSEADEGGLEPRLKKMCRDFTVRERAEQYAHAGQFLELRYRKLSKSQEPVTFREMVQGNSRKKVARCFAYLLRKAGDGKVTLEQDEPYGEIIIIKTRPDCSLAFGQ